MTASFDKKSSSGMALIVVLGLITLLIISSVTFSVLMRVERAGSSNARNTMMARYVTKSALAYAMADIDRSIGNKAYPDWNNTNSNTRPYPRIWKGKVCDLILSEDDADKSNNKKQRNQREVTFWSDTYGSIDSSILSTSFRAPVFLMSYNFEKYLPEAIRYRAYARAYQSGSMSGGKPTKDSDIGSEWVPVTSGNSADTIVGRYAYQAFNTTGYLDLAAFVNGKAERWYGESVEEMVISPDYFDGSDDASYREAVGGLVIDTVADLLTSPSTDEGSIFSESAAFRAFSPTLPEAVITYDAKGNPVATPALNLLMKDKDGKLLKDDKLVAHLKKHRNRIITAFYDSGLKGGTETPNMGRDEACDDCGTTLFVGDKKRASEQAYYAYLALLDYVDSDCVPEGSDEYDQFARPASEPAALFNGFVGTIRIIRTEHYETKKLQRMDANNKPIGNPVEVNIFTPDKFGYSIVVNGMAVYANRMSEAEFYDKFLLDNYMDCKLGFRCQFDDGGFQEKLMSDPKTDDFENIEVAEKDDSNVFVSTPEEEFVYSDGPYVPIGFTVSNVFEASDTLDIGMDADEFQDKTMGLPEMVMLGAIGRTRYDGEIIRSYPVSEDGFNEGFDLETVYINSSKTLGDDYKFVFAGNIAKAYASETEAQAAVNGGSTDKGNHDIRKWECGVVLSGELIDPAFSHAFMADEYNGSERFAAVVSDTCEDLEGEFLTYVDDFGYDPATHAPVKDDASYADFNDFDDKITNADNDGYFELYDGDYPLGISGFQNHFLGSRKRLWEEYGVDIDGIHPNDDDDAISVSTRNSIWKSLYVKCGCSDERDFGYIQSVGELGFIPIGIYSSIRLFGYNEDLTDGAVDYYDPYFLSSFNTLPTKADKLVCDMGDEEVLDEDNYMPYHTVLDQFATSSGITSGKVNLNSTDINALTSVFTEAPRFITYIPNKDTYPMTDGANPLNVDEARAVAESLQNSWCTIGQGAPVTRLSQLGTIFQNQSDEVKNCFANDQERETVIASSCGLFTTRGLAFTILLRGEAYSPLFGRTEVRDGLGTTLASRNAIAQVWRDTVPDEDGKYPMILQFFKMIDE